jgi:hypothetical protein
MKVKSMRGVVLDLAQIMAQNEKVVAVGNAKMNARGDQVGPGGKVIKRREQVAKEYHESNPKAVKKISLKEVEPDVFLSPAEAVSQALAAVEASKAEAAKVQAPEVKMDEKPNKGRVIRDND